MLLSGIVPSNLFSGNCRDVAFNTSGHILILGSIVPLVVYLDILETKNFRTEVHWGALRCSEVQIEDWGLRIKKTENWGMRDGATPYHHHHHHCHHHHHHHPHHPHHQHNLHHRLPGEAKSYFLKCFTNVYNLRDHLCWMVILTFIVLLL